MLGTTENTHTEKTVLVLEGSVVMELYHTIELQG